MIYAFDVYGVTYLDNGVNAALVSVFHDLRAAGHRVVLASNMASEQKKLFWEGLGLRDACDDLLCSGDLGVAKPSEAFYSRVAAALAVEPESIVFFDDSAANVEAARTCGWHAFLYADVPATLAIITRIQESIGNGR